MTRTLGIATLVSALVVLGGSPVRAQLIIEKGQPQVGTTVDTPPSVDDGLANGTVKHAGAPSVDNGVANGVVKPLGAPSVDDGVANGSVKSSTIHQ